jgi:hypothetical protein
MNGAIMAPHDWVEKTEALCDPLAPRLLNKKVPNVTNHAPQIKNSRNIMNESCSLVVNFIDNY